MKEIIRNKINATQSVDDNKTAYGKHLKILFPQQGKNKRIM